MIVFSKDRLNELFGLFHKQRILVVGDFMLDRYLWGKVSRISPEAPVPVVEVISESHRFGGAANVCFNVHAMGAKVLPVGVTGDDVHGQTLRKLFIEHELDGDGLITDADRPTTVKTRIIAHNQQVVRTDIESRQLISKSVQDRILAYVSSQIAETSCLVLEDYNKGLLSPDLIKAIIDMANTYDVPVLVDPKFDHFFDYKGVTLFKPNRKEVSDKMGERLDSIEAIEHVGRGLIKELDCSAVLITLGEEGLALIEKDKDMVSIPTKAQKVHDVSGAGDTVIAALSVVMSAGGSLSEAAVIANHAAGLVVAEVGIVPVNTEMLLAALFLEAVK
ncbi:D-glycero-beta-D-manno-heptose-7-phosphate kinase [bacterium]|nr:D-glycero-beta-D-manno-heptose-7-phosphate kinase [bacterium]